MFKRLHIFIALVLISTLPACNKFYDLFYADPVKCYKTASINKPYDAIIVPGYPYNYENSACILKERVSWACYLYTQGYTKRIIFSGSAVYTPYTEARVMQLYAIRAGVNPKDIWIESKAEHTAENLYYSYLLAKDSGLIKIAFATHTNQASSMKRFSKRYKINVQLLPINDSVPHQKFTFDSINVTSLVVPDFVSIKKRDTMIKRLRGTRGHNVKVAIRKARRAERKNKKN